jgi:hypothetical protein
MPVRGGGNHDGSIAGQETWRHEIPYGIHEKDFCLVESDDMRMTLQGDNVTALWLVRRAAGDTILHAVPQR